MFDPRPICAALNEAGVRYIVVGGFAGAIHGSPLPTSDVDIVPDRTADNLERLGEALTQLGARIRTEGGPVSTRIDGPFLANLPFMLNLVTDYGDVDVAFQPAGPRQSYDDWRRDAIEVEIADGVSITVASLDAIIDSKRTADRPKDQAALPYLESLRDRIDRLPPD